MKESQTKQMIHPILNKLLAIFLIFSIDLAANRAHRLGNETDYASLLAIKRNLVDRPDGVLSSWNSSLSHCGWVGVTCGSKHNRVIKLDLSSRSLVGSISPFIGNLSFLTEVLLYNNSLVGQIPPEFGHLFRLQKLALFNNTLDGEIPANLSACVNLQRLSFARNNLEGNLPLGLRALSILQFLAVGGNNFRGPLFEIVSNLTSLEVISAYGNAFTGNVPMSIGKMLNLNSIYVGLNNLFGTIPASILNCTLLENLDLSINNFHGQLPPDIGLKLPHLVTLDLTSNQFSGLILEGVLNLTNLGFLSLGENNFVGRVSHNFGSFKNLWCLDLESNYLEGRIDFVGSLVNSSELEVLYLGGNKFTGTIPESIANLSTSLQRLSLGDNRITGRIPIGISNLINLESIAIDNSGLTGSIPRDLGKLQKLESLYLDNNNLNGKIPDTLGSLPRLSIVYLQNNQLEGKVPPSLGRCQSLLRLDLSSNHLNGTLMDALFKGPAMFISVNLSNNLLEGPIPLEISKQINLVDFFVSQNKLSGIIPLDLGDCFSLKALDIHANFFHGEIPSSFSSLGSLQFVDFSRNNLSGTIPNFFSKFPLQFLNLSHNNFEGGVPTKGVFANISAIALDGNIEICGGIPELHLPKCKQPRKTKKGRKISNSLKFIVLIGCAFVGMLVIVTCIYLIFHKKRSVPTSSGSIRESFMKVSYDTLLKSTDGFSSDNLVGAGTFGTVFKGVLDGMTIAVKVLNLQTRGASKSFMAECKALRNVRHRNLVGIITACSSIDFHRNDFKALVYEFMPNGSLDGWLHGNRAEKLTLLQRVDIATDVAHALNYLHHDCEIPIVHCDLKPSNVLLDNDMVARVGDFGLAKFLAQPQHPNQSSSIGLRGTLGYAAPEYGIGNEPSADGDIYSYGILVLELMTGKRPTDNMFQGYDNLHDYVKAALPDNVLQIVDPTLEDNEFVEDDNNTRTVQAVSQQVECMVSVIGVGVACSENLPQDRMKISDAISKLRVARDSLCNPRQRRNFARGNM